MSKFKVVVGTLFVDGIKYGRGDIVETDQDLGTRVEPFIEPDVDAKPKRKRRTKAEIESESLAEFDVPRYGE